MKTLPPPSEKQRDALNNQLLSTFGKVGVRIEYHNCRMNFFKKWNLSLKFIDAIVGVGGLVLICLYPEKINSFGLAGVAVLLLFLNVLFDFSKKEETHRWILSSYMGINKLIPDINIKDWSNLSGEDYKKYKKILSDILETKNSLQKEECPMLDFLYFLSGLRDEEDEEDIFILCHVKWWQSFLADYFSMPNSSAFLLEKLKTKEEKKEQQQENSEPKTP